MKPGGPWSWWGVAGLVLLTWPLLWSGSEWVRIWPSVVALVAVFWTRKILAGLFLGALTGSILLANGNPVVGAINLPTEFVIPALSDRWNISVLVFTLMMGGFVGLLEAGGGMRSVAGWLLRLSRHPKRQVEMGAVGMGGVCFFDGLANALLVGRVMKPLADRAGVAGVRMAYLVDSTSSPIACLALVSTWIAYQLSMIQKGFEQAGVAVNPYVFFWESIPFNFYCWLTLILVVLTVWKGWDIGPMREFTAKSAPVEKGEDFAEERGGAWRALLPVLILGGSLIGGLYWNGRLEGEAFSLENLAAAFGRAQADRVMVVACSLGCVAAALSAVGRVREQALGVVFVEGMMRLFVPSLILIGAWALSGTLKGLETPQFLSQLLGDWLAVGFLPVLVFGVAALVAFSTGTSWGTMGIMMPLAIPVALVMGEQDLVLVSAVVGAVFSGAVFGDHASPLSDTTIVSAVACGVDPMDHVRTQLPYALIAAGVAALVGFLPTGWGLSPWVGLAVGAGILVLLVVSGKRVVGER